jgi:hypothetical protein
MGKFICLVCVALAVVSCGRSFERRVEVHDSGTPESVTPEWLLVIDSQSPGPGWDKHPAEQHTFDDCGVRSLEYDSRVFPDAVIQAVALGDDLRPDEYAASEIKRKSAAFPDVKVSDVVVSADGKCARYSLQLHHPTGVMYAAYVKLPGVSGLVQLWAKADVGNAEALKAAFDTVLGSLMVHAP